MTNRADLIALMEHNRELVMDLPHFRYEVGNEGRKVTILFRPNPDEEKGTPRWERPKNDFCPRCASDILQLVELDNNNKEVVVKQNCTSCEWTY